MPKVVPLQVGSNVTMQMGLSEQSRAMQAARNSLHLANTGGLIDCPEGVWTYPQDWPQLQINIGPAGTALCMFGCAATDAGVGVAVDGTVGLIETGSGWGSNVPFGSDRGTNWNAGFGITTGLTPGWHEFQLQVNGLDPGVQATYPFLIVWPV